MHDGRIRTLSGADPPIVFVYATTPPSAASRREAMTDGDLIRRFAPPARLAVPENCCGLTLFLAVFDRCGKRALALSATGSAKALFPLHRGDRRAAVDGRIVGATCGRLIDRGKKEAAKSRLCEETGTSSAPVCALGHLPRARGRLWTAEQSSALRRGTGLPLVSSS